MARIEVIQIEFWDGTKYIARTDKADCHDVLKKATLEKRMVWEALSREEQTKIAKRFSVDLDDTYSIHMLHTTCLSKRTLKTIDEELYNKIKMKG